MTPANENRTHIYRIRRKSDGLFLMSSPDKKTPLIWDQVSTMWGPTGVFWRKPETIRAHLIGLCQRKFYICEEQKRVFDLRRARKGPRQLEAHKDNPFWLVAGCDTPVHHAEPRYEWLNKYEVIATEITVHGENTMEAVDFAALQEDKIGNKA